VIFIGIDDSGHIVGLELDFKQRDRLEQKIRQLARSRIRPIPVVQVGFENARGLEVAIQARIRRESCAGPQLARAEEFYLRAKQRASPRRGCMHARQSFQVKVSQCAGIELHRFSVSVAELLNYLRKNARTWNRRWHTSFPCQQLAPTETPFVPECCELQGFVVK
jgi:hypothetical protein